MSEALLQAISALGLEIAAIRKKGSGTQIELRGREFAGQSEGSWLYRFLRYLLAIRDVCGNRSLG